MKHISKSPTDTKMIAEEFVKSLLPRRGALVVALQGDLGAGKTTFSQFFGEALGIRGPIQSPTFVIEKIYELYREPWQHLIHIDAYRIEYPDELLHLGWNEIASKPENIILLEWADRVEELLPPDTIRISITHVNDTTRDIYIQDDK